MLGKSELGCGIRMIQYLKNMDSSNMEHLIVYHCAPTLAGLKLGALICVPMVKSLAALRQQINAYNEKYNQKDIYFTEICQCKERLLVYVYRKRNLAIYLQQSEVQSFMQAYGYGAGMSVSEAVICLSQRFHEGEAFPHELGIFLGYPLADVKSFIKHGGNAAKHCGEWKVYHDVHKAQREFKKYEVCRREYWKMYSDGYHMDYLVVA